MQGWRGKTPARPNPARSQARGVLVNIESRRPFWLTIFVPRFAPIVALPSPGALNDKRSTNAPQRALQVASKVSGILDPHGQADERIADSQMRPLLRGNRGMCHDRRVLD